MMVSHLLLFPIHYSNSIIPFPVRVVFVLTVIAISFILDLFYRASARTMTTNFVIIICDIIRKPFMMLLCCFAIYSLFDITQLYFPHTFNLHTRIEVSSYLSLFEIITVVWILFRGVTQIWQCSAKTRLKK